MSQVIIFGAGAGTLEFMQAEPVNLTTLTTYTFAGADIGSPGSDRYVVAMALATSAVPNRTLNSVTIGGVAATIHANASGDVTASSTAIAAIAGRLVPAGATADITFTFSNSMTICGCHVYVLRRLRSLTPHHFAVAETAGTGVMSLSSSINVPANGVLLMCAAAVSVVGTMTMGGVTELWDEEPSAGAAGFHSGGGQGFAAEVGRAISSSKPSFNSAYGLAAASFA